MFRSGFPQSCRQPGHPHVFLKEMHRPQDGTVTHLAAQAGQPRVKIRRVYLPQHLAAKLRRHRSHLPRDGRIIFGQVGMAAAGIHHIQGHAPAGKVAGQPLYNGHFRAQKVNAHSTAHRRGGLIHQTAGLAEILVLGVLSNARQHHRRDRPAVIQPALDLSQQQLKCCRRRKPRTGRHRRGAYPCKAACRIALLPQSGKNASNQRRRMSPFSFIMRHIPPVHRRQRVAFAAQLYRILLRRDHRQLIQRYCSRQHPPVLVVGMVASQLGASRRREKMHVFPLAVPTGKFL